MTKKPIRQVKNTGNYSYTPTPALKGIVYNSTNSKYIQFLEFLPGRKVRVVYTDSKDFAMILVKSMFDSYFSLQYQHLHFRAHEVKEVSERKK